MIYGVTGLTNTILKPFLRDGQLTINHRFLFSIEWKTIFLFALENLGDICFFDEEFLIVLVIPYHSLTGSISNAYEHRRPECI